MRHTGIVSLLLVSLIAACDGTSPDGITLNLAGIWDARFVGTVVGSQTSQTDDFTLSITQSGSTITGTIRYAGLQATFPLSGNLAGDRFEYRSSLTIAGCEFRLEAETTVEPDGRRFAGSQTQSSCEGTALGRVEATRR
jgi:hypothetical protein